MGFSFGRGQHKPQLQNVRRYMMEMQSGPRQMELSIGRDSACSASGDCLPLVVVVVIIAPHGIRINPTTDSHHEI